VFLLFSPELGEAAVSAVDILFGDFDELLNF
jgi:hypothetical protein